MVGSIVTGVLRQIDFVHRGGLVRIVVVCIVMVFGGKSIVVSARGKSRSMGMLCFISFIVAVGMREVFNGVLHDNGRVRPQTRKW
jgi:uncharacterized membrane protein YkvI